MASITIRNLDGEVKRRLRVCVADNGRAMEEEMWLVLRDAVGRKLDALDFAGIILSRNMAVATRNVRDFEDCGVEVVDPLTAWVVRLKPLHAPRATSFESQSKSRLN